MTADGAGTMAIRAATGKSKPTIWRWQERYMHDGADGLFRDAPRGKTFAPLPPEQVAAVIERTLHESAPNCQSARKRAPLSASNRVPSSALLEGRYWAR